MLLTLVLFGTLSLHRSFFKQQYKLDVILHLRITLLMNVYTKSEKGTMITY